MNTSIVQQYAGVLMTVAIVAYGILICLVSLDVIVWAISSCIIDCKNMPPKGFHIIFKWL